MYADRGFGAYELRSPSPVADLPEYERRSFCCGMTVNDLGIFDSNDASIELVEAPPSPLDLLIDSAQLNILLNELISAPAANAWLDFSIDSIGQDPDNVAVTFGVI